MSASDTDTGDDATPELGPPELLPSGRIGRCIDVYTTGRRVYVGTTGKLMCEHGEFWLSIKDWTRADSRQPEGAPLARAESFATVCDCTNARGLQTKYAHFDASDWPTNPRSVYDFLDGKTEQVIGHQGMPLRFAFVNPHGVEVFVDYADRKRCRHGNNARTLHKQQRRVGPSKGRSKRYPLCGCLSLHTPKRQGGVFSYQRK